MKAEERKYKVAIIGAGMAGLYLAKRLAEQGHGVKVFERKRRVEGKACSTLVSERIYGFVPELKALEEHKISGCEIYFPRKTIALKFNPPFFCLPRQRSQEKLAELAATAGAEFIFGHEAQGHSLAEIARGHDRVIGCDGALSPTRKWLGLADPYFHLGIQIFAHEEDFSDLAKTWPTKRGFLWRIPRGHSVEYGIMDDAICAKNNFENFCKERNINWQNYEMKAALIPLGLRLPKNDKITLCGDAAGMAKPWSGGGIVWGFTAADILLKHFPDFMAYRREAMRFFGFQIFGGRMAASLVHFAGRNAALLLPKQRIYDNDFLSIKFWKHGGLAER